MQKGMNPICNKCWDKGFSTELIVISSRYNPTKHIRRNFCNCAKGVAMERKEEYDQDKNQHSKEL